MFNSKTYKSNPNKNEYRPRYIFHVYFHNKGLDFIRIIFRNEEIQSKLPIALQNNETLSAVDIMISANHN